MEFLTFHNVNVISPQPPARVDCADGPPEPPAPTPSAHFFEASSTTLPTRFEVSLDLDAAFLAAPITKQVELAVALLDRLESMTRQT